jgi:hypothetical protein
VVVRDRRRAEAPAQPVIEAADAEQEAQRGGDQRHDDLRVARLFALERGKARDRAQDDHDADAEGGSENRAENRAVPTGSS